MMVIKNDNNIYGIKTREDARRILEDLAQIANDYGWVTVADLKDVCGIDSNYTDNKYGWSFNGIRAAKIWQSDSDYMITLCRSLPFGGGTETKPDPAKVTYREYTPKYNSTPKPTPAPRPLTININTAEMDDYDAVMADIFKSVYTITNREIIVNIV